MKSLSFKEGDKVSYNGKIYVIYRPLNLNWVMGQEANSSKIEKLRLSELMPAISPEETKDEAIDLSSEEDWLIAKERFSAIQPILSNRGNGEVVKDVIAATGYSKATLYRWIEAYETTEKLSALIPTYNAGGKGKSRLPTEVDIIIKSVIEDFYLTKQRNSAQTVCKEVLIRCKNAGIKAPHSSTIRTRITQLSDYDRITARFGKKVADQKYSPKTGSFPEVQHPLSVIQIDHTKVDIIVVDEVYRKPIGRPWITVAIDVYSRMVTGFYISLDPPGAMGTGLAICHSILPKEQWLAKLDVQGEWPCWGVMNVIHVDNAKEFKGTMIKRACEEYNIQLEWRPVATPRYGGHIERLMGTFMKEIHTLPGTTFSNINERKGYDSAKNAVFTLVELEKWLTTYIVNVYHKRVHKALNTTPFAKYSEGIFGTNETAGIGIPSRLLDERKLRLDFMPYYERTVQDYGVVIDNVHYYHDVLRRWINASEPGAGKTRIKTKFIFKRDARDISTLYFWDPQLKEYYPIPYRNTGHPPMSIWEFNEIISRLKEQGKEEFNEDMIFQAYEVLKEIESAAIERTKKTKRMNGKLLKRSESRSKINETKEHVTNKAIVYEFVPPQTPILPFDDIEL